MVGSPSSLNQSIFGSIKDCGKLPTYPSPDPTFCTKRENKLRLTELGEGWVDEIAELLSQIVIPKSRNGERLRKPLVSDTAVISHYFISTLKERKRGDR